MVVEAENRVPLRQRTADLSREKERRHLIQATTWLLGWCFFSAIISASLEYKYLALEPIPLDVDEDQGCEAALINMLNPFPIRPDFLLLIPLVGGFQGEPSVAGGHRIEDSDVLWSCAPLSSDPESTSIYVHLDLVGGVGRPVPHMFTVMGEKSWFSRDVAAHLPEHTGRHIPHLVVLDAHEFPLFTGHGVVNVV